MHRSLVNEGFGYEECWLDPNFTQIDCSYRQTILKFDSTWRISLLELCRSQKC
jgi:hypothetical protein